RTFRVRLDVEDARQELKPGLFVTARLRVPLAELESSARHARERWRDRTAADLAVNSLGTLRGPAGFKSLVYGAGELAFLNACPPLAIPTSSVIDPGDRKGVFMERVAGMFDGIEVPVGRRCGEYSPVIRGLSAGDRIVTAGAFLLDAETRLNPSLAASYFG